MSNHQILNLSDHAELRVHVEPGARFGDDVTACLAVPLEFRRLACEYPIVFRFNQEQRRFAALALMGFEAGENLLLDGDTWHAANKPMALAIQPFLIGRSRDAGGRAQVHIDLDHPRVSLNGEGMRLFDDSCQPTPYLEQVVAMLEELDVGHRASEAFFVELDRYDLLEPFALDIALGEGREHRLVGYHLIDEAKLRALEPAAIGQLHEAGHLLPMFMALASLGNLSKLARRRVARSDG